MARIAFGADFVEQQLRHPRQRQRQLAAGVGRRDDRRAAGLRRRQPGAGRRALHPRRRHGPGHAGRRHRPGPRRDDGRRGARPARPGRARRSSTATSCRRWRCAPARPRSARRSRRSARWWSARWPGGSGCRCAAPGAFTSSKVPDGQAMLESAVSMQAAILCGANFILHSAGWLEGGLTMGYEKFMMDADFCGALHTYLRGHRSLRGPVRARRLREVGPGKHFFGAQHTLRHYETAFWDSWVADNSSLRAMARRRRAAGRGAGRRPGGRDAGRLRAAADRPRRRRGAAGVHGPPQGRHARQWH